ncbi:HPP family protein [Candidatus Nitrotoga sp. HW29]|uniref:HPP family protein n=1 Tax=Candidatus Nitrotoga sp. HW29 TaxID=2886963 RepID=UPI001EF25B2A|nr:HPP family protein [Candidatus Nitrotoga sp. HW29]CAH1904094.1 HPP family protein [Candidatus Nitrotoga sp. HW29]
MNFKEFILSFQSHTAPISVTEKIRNGLIAGIAILLLGLVLKYLPQPNDPFVMLGSIAASAVLLFAAPHSPMAQPWPLLGGHLISTLAGWLCSQYIADPLLAAGCAVGLAIFLMHYLNCLHPPGASTALTLVLFSTQFTPMGWPWVVCIVLTNIGTSLVLALLINNLLPGRSYPVRHIPQPVLKTDTKPKHIQLERTDIEWALTQMDGVIDVSEEDLVDIYELAIKNAQNRGGKTNS